MLSGAGPPGLQDPESGRPVDLDTILESTVVSDMVNDLAALGLPGPGIQILNGCADLADLFFGNPFDLYQYFGWSQLRPHPWGPCWGNP